jgi:Zn-dependent protease
MDWTSAILLFGVLLVSMVVHEAAHAWVAMLGGDRTAYHGGQVTLNPIPHIRREPFGMILIPLVILLQTNGHGIMGFASAPVDPLWAARHPRRSAVMAAAGPLSNFLLAAIAFLVLKATVGDGLNPDASSPTVRLAATFLEMNLLLAVLNLMPLPPLDGASVLEGLLPRELGNLYAPLRTPQFALLTLVGVYFIWRYLWEPKVFVPIARYVFSLL